MQRTREQTKIDLEHQITRDAAAEHVRKWRVFVWYLGSTQTTAKSSPQEHEPVGPRPGELSRDQHFYTSTKPEHEPFSIRAQWHPFLAATCDNVLISNNTHVLQMLSYVAILARKLRLLQLSPFASRACCRDGSRGGG